MWGLSRTFEGRYCEKCVRCWRNRILVSRVKHTDDYFLGWSMSQSPTSYRSKEEAVYNNINNSFSTAQSRRYKLELDSDLL